MPYVTEDNLTDVALERWKDIPDPRLREIMQSLIKHLHAFVRDIEPTQAEWFDRDRLAHPHRQDVLEQAPGIHPRFRRAGRQHAGRRDQQSPRRAARRRARSKGRSTCPMRRQIADGGDMAKGAPGIPCFVTGTVRGLDGEPVARRGARPLADRRRGPLRGPARRRRSRGCAGSTARKPTAPTRPHRRADRLHHPDGRPGRRADGPHQHQPHAAGAHPFRDLARPAITASSPTCSRRATSSSTTTWSMA